MLATLLPRTFSHRHLRITGGGGDEARDDLGRRRAVSDDGQPNREWADPELRREARRTAHEPVGTESQTDEADERERGSGGKAQTSAMIPEG